MSNEINPRIKSDFEDAVQRARNLPNQPPDVLLELYGLYKQALEGDVTKKKPGPLNIQGRYKYDAWASQKGKSKEDAMQAYVKLIKKLEES